MYLQLKRIHKKETYNGKFDLVISMVSLYDDNDKWIRHVKLNDDLLKVLKNVKIDLNG